VGFGTQKVYVIKNPDFPDEAKSAGSDGSRSDGKAAPPRPARASQQRSAGERSQSVLKAYLLGPVMAAVWSDGRSRIFWSVVGPGSVAIALLLAALWSHFSAWIGGLPGGVAVWLGVVSVTILAMMTAWAKSISAAGFKQPKGTGSRSRWFRNRLVLAGLGLIVPGLGLMAAERPKRAALAFWLVGPLAIALVVLVHWRWLWEKTRFGENPGVSGFSMEMILTAAAGVAVIAILSWIAQALDGARVASKRRSFAMADTAGTALLVSLVLLMATFHPSTVAVHLHSASVSLHNDGFRFIPLGLCEAASRLDPASPRYQAFAADLNEELGRMEAAAARRTALERRAEEYDAIIRERRVLQTAALDPRDEELAAVDLYPRFRDDDAETWSRIKSLYR
jgi:hypothetical protein